ncbi:hypothetical protein H9L13_00070 [Sphingomonas lutea]|uniref:Uncharacterized protein n=1 Tax=Sphingomonas lutea TaxID=1045317 RepID=A0A7G9SHT8_9SPHN|nr:hypothetical protein [Sphingomonas lutea]QNN67413.1 hypothetical protein H9L13_00070 [Sphingomonas lutea]
MSRVLFLDMAEGDVVARCLTEKVGVSAIERLPNGGTRLVCMSRDGAATMNHKLKKHLIAGNVVRAAYRPASPLW